MRVLGISGSLRSDSHNARLLRAAGALLPPKAQFVAFDGLKAIPPFDEDDEQAPGAAVTALRNKPAAVIGTSTGMFGAVWAQAELRKSLAAAGARVIDRELPVPDAENAFAPDGTLAEHDHTRAPL